MHATSDHNPSVARARYDEHLLAGLQQSKITACELLERTGLLQKHPDFLAQSVVLRTEGLDQLEDSGQLVVGANQCDQSPLTHHRVSQQDDGHEENQKAGGSPRGTLASGDDAQSERVTGW